MNYSLIKFIGQSIEIFFMNYCYHGDIKGGAYKLIHMQLLVNVRFSNLFKMTKKPTKIAALSGLCMDDLS